MNIKEQLIKWLKTKKSIKQWKTIAPEKHFPWLTIDASLFIENYISSLEEQNIRPRVLEYGGGSSTIYFCMKDCQLHTLEHHKSWADSLENYMTYYNLFAEDTVLEYLPKPYHEALNTTENSTFDVILVDGYKGGRFSCLKTSIRLLKPNGIMLLDDVECENNRKGIAEFMSEQGFYTYITKMRKKYAGNRLKVTNVYFKNPDLVEFGGTEG